MLDRPLRVTISTFVPKVEEMPHSTCIPFPRTNPCAVQYRSLKSVIGCAIPGIYAEIYAMVFQHLGISYEIYMMNERKFSSDSSLQPDLPYGAYNETADSLNDLLGALVNGTYDCDINS